MSNNATSRRAFVKKSAALAVGITSLPLIGHSKQIHSPAEEGMYMIGPREGYSPRIGTLLSTMTMMRDWMLGTARGLSVEQLDYLIDDEANSIGAMMWHLAATERYYQLNTFEGMEWGSWSEEIKAEWDLPMNLGDAGREQIKGHKFSFYEKILNDVRAVTEAEFAKRDDEWLMESESFFGNEPTNNHCKWFHVCEHESNHNGQMKFIKKRLPA